MKVALSALKQLLLDFITNNQSSSSEKFFGLTSGSPLCSNLDGTPMSSRTSFLGGSLIPALPDVLVREQIWPLLASAPSMNRLLQLHRVSFAWRRFVGSTIEWGVLTFTFLDSQGYCTYVLRHQMVDFDI